MPDRESGWQRRIQAAESATRLLDEVGLPLDQRVDVFELCESLGLWLVFFPMDELLGAFIPEGAGGVMITTQRPHTIQRYTAAHEIGHWRLDHGHGISLDGEEHVLGRSPNEREQLAQIFAANLLMPAPLVYTTLARVQATERVTPSQAYAVAREAGVSYEAAVRQLEALGVTDASETTSLIKVSPLSIKADLAHGRRPDYGWADVWKVDEQWDDLDVAVHLTDEVVISLPENRSTPYRWMPANQASNREEPQVSRSPLTQSILKTADPAEQRSFLDLLTAERPVESEVNSSVLPVRRSELIHTIGGLDTSDLEAEVVGDVYIPAEQRQAGSTHADGSAHVLGTELVIGGTGRRILGVRFTKAGRHEIHLEYRDRYSHGEPTESYSLVANVAPKRSGLSVDQLLQDDDPGHWTDEMVDRKLDAAWDQPAIDATSDDA